MNKTQLTEKLRRIEKKEKRQEKIVEKKKFNTRRAQIVGHPGQIKQAKAEEDEAIAVLVDIRAKKSAIILEQRPITVKHIQPKRVINIAKKQKRRVDIEDIPATIIEILKLIGYSIGLVALSISFVGYFIVGLIVIGLPVAVIFIIIFPFLGSWAIIPGFLATLLFFIVVLSSD
jgi:hypothetical protein